MNPFLDHNRIHAADVLHGTYYLTYHPVKPFVDSGQHMCPSEDDEDDMKGADSTEGTSENTYEQRRQLPRRSPSFVEDLTALPLAQSMSALEASFEIKDDSKTYIT